jgi:hypothetical protein
VITLLLLLRLQALAHGAHRHARLSPQPAAAAIGLDLAGRTQRCCWLAVQADGEWGPTAYLPNVVEVHPALPYQLCHLRQLVRSERYM